jgi:hypothetical protein
MPRHRPPDNPPELSWEQERLFPTPELRITFTLVIRQGDPLAQFGFMLEDWGTDELLALETESVPTGTHLFYRWASYVSQRTELACLDLLP